jgi:hypothetical protein
MRSGFISAAGLHARRTYSFGAAMVNVRVGWSV